MSTFALSPWDQFFYDFDTVSVFVIGNLRTLLQNIYGNSNWNFLFYAALIPVVLMFCSDLIFTLILSVRVRELRFFNCLSARSWRSLRMERFPSSNVRFRYIKGFKHYGGSLEPKFLRFSKLSVYLMKYRNIKAGDVIRTVDGLRFIYKGVYVMSDGHTSYIYENGRSKYYSSLAPKEWVKSSGSIRQDSLYGSDVEYSFSRVTSRANTLSSGVSSSDDYINEQRNRIARYMTVQNIEREEHRKMSRKYPSLDIVADDID